MVVVVVVPGTHVGVAATAAARHADEVRRGDGGARAASSRTDARSREATCISCTATQRRGAGCRRAR